MRSLDPPQLYRVIFALMKEDIVNKGEKKTIMHSLSLFTQTADNLHKWVLFFRFSLPKMSVVDSSSGNPNLSEHLFTKIALLICWVDFDTYFFISFYADSLLLFWDLIF